jgi:ATP-binding cassette subfamily B protein
MLGLARAYFHETDYVILDEPSASLDPITEDRIFEQLYRLSEGKSATTISHRLSNTTLVNRILVLEDGRIFEEGSHFDFLRKNGKYARMFKLQANRYQ